MPFPLRRPVSVVEPVPPKFTASVVEPVILPVESVVRRDEVTPVSQVVPLVVKFVVEAPPLRKVVPVEQPRS